MPGAVHGHGPLQPAEAPNLELVELISKFVSSGNDERETLRLQYPHLFDDPALSAALAEVSTQLATSLHEVRSTMSAVEGVATAVDLPIAASGGALHLQPGELHHLDSSEALLSHFSSALTDLLTRYVPEPLTNTTVVDRHHSPQRASHACGPTWATTPSIVFTVLSYLPAEAILTEAEEVCTAWQWWLGSPSESNFFGWRLCNVNFLSVWRSSSPRKAPTRWTAIGAPWRCCASLTQRC